MSLTPEVCEFGAEDLGNRVGTEGTSHLGMCVEQLKQCHDQGLHRDGATTVLVQVVHHGGAFLLRQQVPGLVIQQCTCLIPQAAQGHLGASWALVKSWLKDRRTQTRGL